MFVLIEGVDGSGKTTVTSLLCDRLTSLGHQVTKQCEPTRDPIGNSARTYFMSEPDQDPLTAALLMIGQRRVWISKLEREGRFDNAVVISDRGFLSTFVYQGLGVNTDLLYQLHDGIRMPDIVFVLDCEPDEAHRRAHARSEHLSKLQIHQFREGYLSLVKWFRLLEWREKSVTTEYVIVDTTLSSPEAVVEQVLAVLLEKLPKPVGASDTPTY